MDLPHIASTVLIGLAAAFTGGFWGLGGGGFVVPALLLLGVPQPTAAAASLLQMLPTTAPTVARQFKDIGWGKGSTGRAVALPLCSAMFVGGFLGAPLGMLLFHLAGGSHVPAHVAYLALLAWIFVQTVRRPPPPRETGRPGPAKPAVFGVAGGALSGFLGIGGGMVVRPILRAWLRVDEAQTARITRLTAFLTALSASVAYLAMARGAATPEILVTAALLTCGGVVGFPLGAKAHAAFVKAGAQDLATRSFALLIGCVALGVLCKIESERQGAPWLLGLGKIVLFCSVAALTFFLLRRAAVYKRLVSKHG